MCAAVLALAGSSSSWSCSNHDQRQTLRWLEIPGQSQLRIRPSPRPRLAPQPCAKLGHVRERRQLGVQGRCQIFHGIVDTINCLRRLRAHAAGPTTQGWGRQTSAAAEGVCPATRLTATRQRALGAASPAAVRLTAAATRPLSAGVVVAVGG